MSRVTVLSDRRRASKFARKSHSVINSLPNTIPERTWYALIEKEEDELFIYGIRNHIVEQAMTYVYFKYLNKQTILFTIHCAAEALLKVIDWHFYRHDPGDDPSAAPLCYIPKREESWISDKMPEPSPKDSMVPQKLELEEVEELEVVTETTSSLRKWSSADSIDFPSVDSIPSNYWFPGKVKINGEVTKLNKISFGGLSGEDKFTNDSEELQKIVDYISDDISLQLSESKLPSLTPSLLFGAGDSNALFQQMPSKDICRSRRSSKTRLNTEYEVSPEKVKTPEQIKNFMKK